MARESAWCNQHNRYEVVPRRGPDMHIRAADNAKRKDADAADVRRMREGR